jgi:hypothetical protein
MRSLERNKRTLYYAVYMGEEPLLDDQGFETGESRPTYGDINELRCNVSSASGEDAVEAFGSFTRYTRAVCVADNNCPLDEDSIVWFGIPTTEPYNYIVTLKADSKNGIMYALQEVKVRA